MTIWVTGSLGMLGRCVGRRLDALAIPWIGTDAELDIAEPTAVGSFFLTHMPTAVINCAAYTAVDAAETDEATAYRVNASGPAVLARACREHRANFTHVSTDYVFDGEGKEHHREDSPVGPGSAYGRTKLEGERAVAREFEGCGSPPFWLVVRTSWLFGSGRSSFVDTMWGLLRQRSELRVVDDQHGRPTYAADLADLLVRATATAGADPLPSGIWHFANSEPTSWFGFASKIRELMLEAGVNVVTTRIIPVPTEEFPRPARRPKNSVLSTQRLETEAGIVPRSWQDALRDYIEDRVKNEV